MTDEHLPRCAQDDFNKLSAICVTEKLNEHIPGLVWAKGESKQAGQRAVKEQQ
jgi:hypothetical protein